ncbi:MAG: hypothetical protein CL471_17520 [Acidobacteria bacterium]|nr:hypothetical protein [Acidobacteriota bacterium]
MAGRRWFDRKFPPGQPVGAFPEIRERVRGTPARLEERVHGWSSEILACRPQDAWSIQEHVGHLGDLEPLWATRLGELLAGADVLSPADLENRKTHEARHNDASLEALTSAFRRARAGFVATLDELEPDALGRAARHPRLDQPMTIVDLCFFVAEHDDHHLARMSAIARTTG